MRWESLFTNRILQRGKEYWRRGRVSLFDFDDDHCEAEVRGSNRYFVDIYKRDNKYLVFCSCPYSQDGHNCKHEAAVFYAWLGETPEDAISLTEPDSIVYPFAEEDYTDSFYPMAAIMSQYRIGKREYEQALKMMKDNTFQLTEISMRYRNSDEEEAVVYASAGFPGQSLSNAAEVFIDREKIAGGSCYRCHSHLYGIPRYDSNKLCEHQVFLLLHLGKFIREQNPGDRTNLQGQRLIDSFSDLQAEIRRDTSAEVRKNVHLEPRIINDYGLQLAFKIGIQKMYVVKDIRELIEAAENRESMHLGKGNDIHFSYDTFDDASRKYYDFILDRYNETQAYNHAMRRAERSYSGELILKNTIDLYGKTLDQFYDFAENSRVPFEDKNSRTGYGAGFLRIGGNAFRMPLEVGAVKEDGKTTALMLKGRKPVLVSGAEYRYCVQDGALMRLDADAVRAVEPFLNLAYEDEIEARIGRNSFPEFCHRILPILRDNPLVDLHEDIPEDVQAELPAPAQILFRLDLEDGEVLCQGTVTYGEHEYTLQENAPAGGMRDRRLEQDAADTVMTYFPSFDGSVFHQQADDEILYEILGSGLNDLMRYGEVHGSDAFNRLRIRRTPMVSFGIALESDLLSLEVMSTDMSTEELLEILDSYRRKKKFHRLSSGEFISLEQNESLDVLTSMMESMNVSVKEFVQGKLHLPLYRTLYVNKMLEEHEAVSAERDRTFRSLIRTFNTVRDSEHDIPSSMKNVLRGYQAYGYKWLRTLSDCGFGGILADDMGLGKTVQVIAMLEGVIHDQQLKRPALIVCPASVVYNWQEEFRRFTPDITVTPVTGTAAHRKQILEEPSQVFVTSYDLLKRDIGLYTEIQFDYVILDEAQFIKNARAAVSRSVRILHAAHRFALTGTPIENRLSELWSVFDFLMPGFLYSYEQFRTVFETPITRSKDEAATDRLKKMVSPFILRRLKEEVLTDLPEKLEEVRYARFEEEQQRLYDGQIVHMKQMLARMDENSGESRIRVLAELTRIRQICCDPALISEDYHGASAKREACLELIESAIDGGHKMLVFSQFTTMLELLEKDLQERNIRYYKLTGATSKEDRIRYVKAFNEDDVPVFLISLKAGGTGLNLTGADVVIHYDPWWNLAVQNQATDRAHRIGQTNKVSVYKLIIKDSLEEKILALQESKKDLADAILSGENTSITSLSKEELLELLS